MYSIFSFISSLNKGFVWWLESPFAEVPFELKLQFHSATGDINFSRYFCVVFLLLFLVCLIVSMVGNHKPGNWGPVSWESSGTLIPPCCTELICHCVSSRNQPQAQNCLSNMFSVDQFPLDSHTKTPAIQKHKCVIKEHWNLFLSCLKTHLMSSPSNTLCNSVELY